MSVDQKEYHARWRASNRERTREHNAKWRAANPGYFKKWTADNFEKQRRYAATWRKANPHASWLGNYRSRAKKFGITPVVEPFIKADVISTYGDHCFYCDEGAFEEIDHFIPVCAGGHHTLANIRPSCRKCNRKKISQDKAKARKQ